MEKFGDPEFLTHATAARLYTLIAMRAAAAEVVPLKFVPYGLALREHVDELRLIHAQTRAQGRSRQAGDVEPSSKGFPSLVEAVQAFQVQAEELDRATEAVAARDAVRPRQTWPRSTTRSRRSSGRFCSRRACRTVPGSSTRSTHPA